jgi:hypothetical protein
MSVTPRPDAAAPDALDRWLENWVRASYDWDTDTLRISYEAKSELQAIVRAQVLAAAERGFKTAHEAVTLATVGTWMSRDADAAWHSSALRAELARDSG